MKDDYLNSKLELQNHTLELITPIKPSPEAVTMNYDGQFINSIPLEEYTIQINEKTKNFTFIDKLSQSQAVKLPISDAGVKTPELTEMIGQLSSSKFEDLESLFIKIVDILSDSLYSLSLQKEMAILIVVNTFECAKSDDYRFDDLISKKYFDIFYSLCPI